MTIKYQFLVPRGTREKDSGYPAWIFLIFSGKFVILLHFFFNKELDSGPALRVSLMGEHGCAPSHETEMWLCHPPSSRPITHFNEVLVCDTYCYKLLYITKQHSKLQ